MIAGLFSVLIGYLLGSFPSAYIMGKARKGIDIREVDNHNMGAGSTIRQVGLWEGIVVAIVDMAKGAGAVWIAQTLDVHYLFVFLAAFAALLGHNFPFSIGFRGGQGVATVIGIFIALAPGPMVLLFGIMGAVLVITRHIFSMSFVVGLMLPIVLWIFSMEASLILFSILVVAYIVFRSRHRLRDIRLITRSSN